MGVGQEGVDGGVAGDPACHLVADGPDAGQFGRARGGRLVRGGASAQRLLGGDELDLGADPADDGGGAGGEEVAGEVGQGVGAALGGGGGLERVGSAVGSRAARGCWAA